MIIYKGQYGWQEQAKGKTMEGEEISKFINVKFAKSCGEPKGFNCKNGSLGANINPTSWFHSCYKKKDGSTDVTMVIMEFTEKTGKGNKSGTIVPITNASEMETEEMREDDSFIEADALPFY